MKFGHALGFFAIGTAMLVIAQLAPALCPRNGFDGTSARQLWLNVMGSLQVVLGGAGGLRNVAGALGALARALPGVTKGAWQRMRADPRVSEAEAVVATGAERVVAFEGDAGQDWSERRAA